MTEESKIALATAEEEARVAYEFLKAANAKGASDQPGHVQSLIEGAAQRFKIALRKCSVVHRNIFTPIHARGGYDRRGSHGEQEARIGSDAPEAYQTVAPAITLADSRHIMAREVVRDAS